MRPIKEKGRKVQRTEVRKVIFRNGNIKVNDGKSVIQVYKG